LVTFGSLPHGPSKKEVVVARFSALIRLLFRRRRRLVLPPWAEIVRAKAGL